MKPSSTHFPLSSEIVLRDYKIAYSSRFASLLGRKEVLNGRAKFGIFGDGKEVAQLAMAHAFKNGDWRSGYYRDQTFMFAIGATQVREFFSQLYADPDLRHDPASGGRQMNAHFSTAYIDENGKWMEQVSRKNSSSDISPTGGQMARLLGLAYASKLYKQSQTLSLHPQSSLFSRQGQEVAFGTIGNASTSEGVFWEALNAAGVLQIPMALSVWDDGYGISVPSRYQTTKESISELTSGFKSSDTYKAFDIYTVCGYDYEALVMTYIKAIETCRRTHSPCLIHVKDLTQPQGHSTSGSHERYKSKERLQYEESIDCNKKMREWILAQKISSADKLDEIEKEAEKEVEQARSEAWELFQKPIDKDRQDLLSILVGIDKEELFGICDELRSASPISRKQIFSTIEKAMFILGSSKDTEILLPFYQQLSKQNKQFYNSALYSQHRSPLSGLMVPISYPEKPLKVDGRQIIQKYFEIKLADDPRIFIVGEDVGKLGGVNLEFEGLNEKFGELRVTDTGIREATILGQGIGAAMRGLRPVVDIQYLDYLLYALQGLSDDLATLQYRTVGTQTAPVIVRTKGHRLEGIWHTGSPMGMLLGSIRGVHLCVPRNCTQAVGMYQTLLAGDDPGLVIEVLNGYRVKEDLPSNLGVYTIPLGVCEILKTGSDLTLVTYGACVRVAEQAILELDLMGISVELVDVQTLLPFDLNQSIRASIEKTHAVLFFDEDVSGGATAYMMQKVLEEQNAYDYLDAAPQTLSAQDHRSAYGSDGDYFSKPNVETLVKKIYGLMRERFPERFTHIDWM